MTGFQAKFEAVTPESNPDEYMAGSGRPTDNFIVTKAVSGAIASLYGDLRWDFSAYHPERKAHFLYFDAWNVDSHTELQQKLISDVKWVLFLLIYMKRGVPLAFGTLYNYLKVFKHLMRSCDEKRWQLPQALNSSVILDSIMAGHHDKSDYIASVLDFLYELGVDVVGFEVLGSETIKALRAESINYRKESTKQHAPIPTRVYSEIITRTSKFLDEFVLAADGLLAIATYMRAPAATNRKYNHRLFEAPELIEQHQVAKYLKSRELPLSMMGVSNALSEAIAAIKIQIQLFSGMRTAEVSALPYDCLRIDIRNGKEHYIIHGRTTKLNYGLKKSAAWVTSDSGRRAIGLAQKIAMVMYKGTVPADGYLFIVTLRGFEYPKNIYPTVVKLAQYPLLHRELRPLISNEDLVELEQIDPFRPWRTEGEYQVGKPWPLRGHQFRRSLALYAQRSGLVTLPTLKRQLQHITEEMSQYYARGSEFATNFIGGQLGHVGSEWRDTQPVSQYLGYVANVLLTDDTLFGGHANWVHARIPSKNGIIQHDREATLDRFKHGQMAYRETAIGGCVNTGTCESGMLDVLDISCLKTNCKNLIVNSNRLDRAIAAQTKRVNSLAAAAPDSPEFRSEQADLNVLIQARDKG
jgi:hypothetical protein